MKLGHRRKTDPVSSILRLLPISLTSLLLSSTLLTSAAKPPTVSLTHFPNLPSKLFYFDDTPVIIYHDSQSRTVYRSDNEGSSFRPLDEIQPGEAWQVIQHPNSREIAYVLTEGLTHWRTLNRGKSWQTFQTPLPPAGSGTMGGGGGVDGAMSFHAYKDGWVIWSGKRCKEGSGGGWPGFRDETCWDETFYTLDNFQSQPKALLPHTPRCIWAHSTKEFLRSDATPDSLVYCITSQNPDAPASQSSSTDLSKVSSHLDKEDHHKSPIENIIDSLMGISGPRVESESRLYRSSDFFQRERTFVDLGIGKDARGLVGIGSVMGYIVTAMKPALNGIVRIGGGGSDAQQDGSGDDHLDGGPAPDEMVLYVTQDSTHWTRAKFPHGHGLKENAYTIVESTPHSILVDVLSSPFASVPPWAGGGFDSSGGTGVLFRSNSNGTYFVRSLEGTNRNERGIVDFEKVVGVEGVAIANVVRRWETGGGGMHRLERKKIGSKITFDDGGHWRWVRAPSHDDEGKRITKCDTSDLESCSLHFHSVTRPHNYGRVFSSSAPGMLMAVGSIGESLAAYDDSDTFLSLDAGESWKMIKKGAHKYEFGDQGAILVMIDDEEATNEVEFSYDFGKSWESVKLPVSIRARLLTTVPDSTSKKFLLLGTLSKKSAKSDSGPNGEKHVVLRIDFAGVGKKTCDKKKDFEKWYARVLEDGKPDCLMGHKQYFMRRKADADCFVNEKYEDPVGVEENCPCSEEDYECDYNFVPEGDDCVPAGPELIPAGQCLEEGDRFMGSSGFRKIPGNTCNDAKGIKKDKPKEKDCKLGMAAPGLIQHQRFQFPSFVRDQFYFDESRTILAYTTDAVVWQSNNDGFTWRRVSLEDEKILSMLKHPYDGKRGFLVTNSRKVYYTYDAGAHWRDFQAPLDANGLDISLMNFHPDRPEWLIWTGSEDCTDPLSPKCKAVAFYSKDNGGSWTKIESYVRTCNWGRDKKLKMDDKIIFCESYKDKTGSQATFEGKQLQLVRGKDFYKNKKVVFENIVGFATFEQYMVVAELLPDGFGLNLQISLNGDVFAQALFPPNMRLEKQAFTVLESSTDSIFLHTTTHATMGAEWGTLFKSNWNGTYYALSLEHVNRNGRGYVDFEKMIGLDGIALINTVKNPDEASITGQKQIETRITHNDGGRWKPLIPPQRDSLGQSYHCTSTACSLHIHGYTERRDPRATYSSPTAVGLMVGVGNVGESLAPYTDSDTFLTRDGGFSWEEVHKDAHIWEFGDQGSIIIIANDEVPTDRVTYTLNEGLSWQDYNFGETIRVLSIQTVPNDASRKFILFGVSPSNQGATVAIHLDFSKITNVKCNLDLGNPNNDDFELWSPSEQREEKCLFGRQVMYHRRIRDRACYVGELIPQPFKKQRDCLCTEDDFECEFNHRRDPVSGLCTLVPGSEPLGHNDTCSWDQDYWYERTAYRKVPHSSCVDGKPLDRGRQHNCPGNTSHGGFFWATVFAFPVIIAGLFTFWWMRRRGGLGGRIYLPSSYDSGASGGGWNHHGGAGGVVDTLASVPYFFLGLVAVSWSWVSERWPDWLGGNYGRGVPYRQLPIDDDAEVLGEYLDDD